MIQRFLVDIDPAFARAQYEIFTDRFGNGIGVREYPKGTAGQGDGDSGPLILGMSLSATVVALGAARVQHDPVANRLSREGELLGLPLTGLKTKRYLFGAMPIGDAFLAWSASARPLVATEQPKLEGGSPWWWLPWLLVLLLPALILWGFVRFRPRRRPRRAH